MHKIKFRKLLIFTYNFHVTKMGNKLNVLLSKPIPLLKGGSFLHVQLTHLIVNISYVRFLKMI